MGNAGVKKFWIHDLRRTFATTAIDYEAAEVVIERCLNHKKRSSTRPYDVSNRSVQRTSVYEMMADIMLPLTGFTSNIIEMPKRSELQRVA